MNKAELIAKTINNKKGYKYHTYETEHLPNGIINVYHYGTLILSFSLTNRLENGEYAKLGNGWSASDSDMISTCLNHVRDFTKIRYELLTIKESKRSYCKFKWLFVDKGLTWVLGIEKEIKPTQKTLYAFTPFSEYAEQLKRRLKEEIEIAKKQIEKELNKQIKYAQSFSNAQMEINETGLLLKRLNIFIDWNGNVVDLDTNEYHCVQIEGYRTEGLTQTDIAITKALGILKRPQVMNEGIKSVYDEKPKTLAEVLLSDIDSVNKRLTEIREEMSKFEKTLISGYKPKRRRKGLKETYFYAFKWYLNDEDIPINLKYMKWIKAFKKYCSPSSKAKNRNWCLL